MPVSALLPYTAPFTEKQLRHLLSRTLFGVTQNDLDFFKGKNMDECVAILLRDMPVPPPPMFRGIEDADLPEGTSFVFAPFNKGREDSWTIFIKGWWIERMMEPQKSITEKMVLFWHNHFAVQFTTIMDPRYDYGYLNSLYQHATGNFKQLLRQITTNPAMLVFLNGNLNNKATPNENYGRELQELFTVGKGVDSHYTEDDVKAAARVLTGWKDDREKINSFFDAANHNTDDKIFSAFYNNRTIKGRSGDEGARETDELLAMICAQQEVSKFLCRKLYRWFVNSHIDEQVEKDVIAPLAEIMRQADYEMQPVLQALLTGTFFYEPDMPGAMFKSPTDYFIGMARQLNLEICKKEEGWFLLLNALDTMGQNVGDPPSVAGWPAYYEFPFYDKNWIVSECLSARNRWVKGISFFLDDIYNPMPLPKLEFNFLDFANSLPNAADPIALVADSLNLLCPIVQPGLNQMAYLQQRLVGNERNKKSWAQVWAGYKKNPENEPIRDEAYHRLRDVFTVIAQLPEYYIM